MIKLISGLVVSGGVWALLIAGGFYGVEGATNLWIGQFWLFFVLTIAVYLVMAATPSDDRGREGQNATAAALRDRPKWYTAYGHASMVGTMGVLAWLGWWWMFGFYMIDFFITLALLEEAQNHEVESAG